MKVFKYILLGATITLSTSCGESWLDLEPSTQIQTDSAIQNLSHVE